MPPNLFSTATTFGSGAARSPSLLGRVASAATGAIGWISLGLSVLSIFKGTKKKKDDAVGTQLPRTKLRFGIAPAQHILGEIMDEGMLVYACQGPNSADTNLNGNTLHLVICFQVGEADSITGVSYNKNLVPVEVDRDFTRVYAGAGAALKPSRFIPAGFRGMRIIPYLNPYDAAGQLRTDRGKSIRDAYTRSLAWTRAFNRGLATRNADREEGTPAEAAIPEPEEWTTAHQGQGLAYIHVELTNNAAGIWQKFPDDLEFRIRGVKPAFPTSSNALSQARQTELGYRGPEWTDNAAAIWYWYLTQIRHIPPSRINIESFLRAFEICETRYTLDFGEGASLSRSGYSRHSDGYSINGKIINTDDPVKIERELGAAIGGGIVFDSGTFHIIAGGRQEPKWIITEDDLLEIAEDQMGAGASRNVIGLRIGLAQSREHDFQPLDLPPVRERDTPQAGGEIIDFGTRAFVTDPAQGQRLAELALQEERDERTVRIVVSPGDNYERMAMRIGEACHLVLPDLGDPRTWIIKEKSVDAELRIQLALSPEPDYTPKMGPLPRKQGLAPPGTGAAEPPEPDPTLEGPYGYAEG